jgi:hypothetical protein
MDFTSRSMPVQTVGARIAATDEASEGKNFLLPDVALKSPMAGSELKESRLGTTAEYTLPTCTTEPAIIVK